MALDLKQLRTITFGVATVFSILLLGLGGYLNNKFLGFLDFGDLAIAAGVLTMLSLPAMYIIQLKRPGTPTGWVAVEVSWISLLWILWLACAARAADFYHAISLVTTSTPSLRGSGLGFKRAIGVTYESVNGVIISIIAFGFVLWLLLMGYTIILVTFAVKATNKGKERVWTETVDELASQLPQEKGAESGAAPYPTTTMNSYGSYPPK